MSHKALPLITWRTPSEHHARGWQSVLIALVRGLAAMEVAASHLRAVFYPGMHSIAAPSLWYKVFAFLTGFGHQAVLLFFVISGWLVGGSLLDKWRQPDAIAHYAIDRATRLWTVLVPVFLLTLLLAGATGRVSAGLDYAASNEYSLLAFIGNLVGLQLIAVPNFGDNFALWSLSNESWYYIFFPMLILMLRTSALTTRTTAAVLLTLLAITLPPSLVLYFSIWLLGAACSRLQLNCRVVLRSAIIALAGAASVYFRMTGVNDDLTINSFVHDALLSALFLLILCSLQHTPAPVRPVMVRVAALGRSLAEFSFTLYVIHVPLIHALQVLLPRTYGSKTLSPHSLPDFLVCAGMFCFLLTSAWLFYLLFEAHTPQVRRWAKRKLLRPAPAVVVPA